MVGGRSRVDIDEGEVSGKRVFEVIEEDEES